MLKHPGFHGVRELQRELEYSSPGSVIYHLKRLQKHNLITKSDEGKYLAAKNEEDGEILLKYLESIQTVLPKFTYLAISIFSMTIINLVISIVYMLPLGVTILLVLPLLIVVALIVRYNIQLIQNLQDLSNMAYDRKT